MASRILYTGVAAVGIAAAAAAAWWYQSRPVVPKEVGAPPAAAARAGASAPGGPAARPAGVEVARVEATRLQDDAQAVGTLRSRQSVMLRPEVAGRVVSLGFADGAAVKAGQLLVQLDDTLQKAERSQAQAQVSIAQANFKRNQDLVAQNFVAQRVLDESAAALQVAQAQLALADARLARMRIVAPFDGVLGLRSVNLGDYVKDGADLVNLEDLSTMLVDFRLPERFQTRLRRGQRVELQLDAFPGRQFEARVEAIDPLLDANGRSVAVRATLPNTGGVAIVAAGGGGAAARPGGATAAAGPGLPAAIAASAAASSARRVALSGGPVARGSGSGGTGPLRAGMFARVTAVFDVREAALMVPEEAIVPQGGRQFVIKVVEPSAVPGTATAALPPEVKSVSLRQEVRLGVRRQGKVELLDGVKAGETVVVAGQQRLQRDGTPVRIVEAGRPGAPAPGAGAGPGGGATPAAGPGSSAGGSPGVPVSAASAAVPPAAAAPPAGTGSAAR
jgi:membrane fusion protein (multidrug efflux system)